MNKAKTHLILCFFLFVSWGITGHARGLESRTLGNQLFESNPKNVLTTTFEITNTTDQRIECIPSIELPPGWKIITPPTQFGLDRNQTTVVLVSFYIPDDAVTDTYKIENIFSSMHDPSISTHQSITVRVLPVSGLKLRLIDAPQSVISGHSYRASFLVINESNQEQRIILHITSSNEFPFVADADEFALSPGGSHTINVDVQSKEITTAGSTHRVQCTAVIAGQEEIQAEAESLVEIIPVRAREIDQYNRVPTTIRLSQALELNKQTNTPFQAEMQGQGTLDEEGHQSIEFLFRGPDTLDKSLFGTRDNYYLRTWDDTYDIALGDRQFSLSELTEQYLSARGADGLIAYKGLMLRSYYAKSRWITPQVTEEAAALGYSITDNARFSMYCLNKDRDDIEKSDELVTTSAELKPLKGMDLLLEGGTGKHLDVSDNAYLVKFSWFGDRFSSLIKYIYAEPNFPGYYQDKELFSMDLSRSLSESLQVNAAIDREKDNLDQVELQQSAGLDTQFHTGMNYRYGTNTTYTATWQYRNYKDQMLIPSFDFTTNTFRTGVLSNFSNLSFNLFGEAGEKKDHLTSQTELIYQISTSIYLSLTKDQTYGGYLRYGQGENAETGKDRNITAGLTGSINLTHNTQIQSTAQVDSYPDAATGNKYTLTASLNHSFADKSTLSLQAAKTFSSDHENNDDETSVLLEYSYPFGLPVSKKRGTNTVSGVVRDALTGEPLANVLLRLDEMTAATNRDGRFMFSYINQGVSYLSIDASKVGFDRIPTCPNPLPIRTEPGQGKTIEISITRKAVLTGKVMLYKLGTGGTSAIYELDNVPAMKAGGKPEPELKEASGLPNVLVELSNKNETLRVLTDAQGRFRFDEVRPGPWTLNVSTDTLPRYYGLDRNNFSIDFSPGQTQNLTIKAIPKKRSIQIIEQGDTIIQKRVK